jgi:hypothetical protein
MRSLAFVGLAAAFALAAASCSSGSTPHGSDNGARPTSRRDTPPNGGDDGDSNDGSTAEAVKDVCATLDYGHARSNSDFYMKFTDDDAAFEYSKGFLEANQMPEGIAVSHDARLVRLVGNVYGAMQKVFPSETAGLDTPPLIITVKDDTVNAFAGFDDRENYNKAPWMFWIHEGTLNADIPDNQLEGLFAHELAHLVLRNYLPETRSKIRTHYRVPGQKEQGVIGAVTADDPVVRDHTEELRTLGKLVSRDFVAEVLPYSPFEEADYQSLLTTLHGDQQGSADPNACQTADNDVAKMKAIYQNAASVHAIKLNLTQQQQAQLTALGNDAADAMKKCYAHVNMSLFELKIRNATTDSPADQVNEFVKKALDPTTDEHKYAYGLLMTNDVEQQVDTKTDETTIDRFLEVVDTLHKRILDLEADTSLPLDELRVFDLEEDSDDAAVRILRVIGDDPLSAGYLYVNQMEDPQGCFNQVKSGAVPAYGEFIDPHNATCWRWFHTNQLALKLNSCPTIPKQPASSSSGSAPSSPADRRPMDLRPLRVVR